MTIAERNKKAISYIGLLRKILKEDYSNCYDKDDLFQVGFMAILQAIGKNDPTKGKEVSFIRANIKNKLRWYMAEEMRTTHFDANSLNDEYDTIELEEDIIEQELTYEQLREKLNKLLEHVLTCSQIDLLKLYFGFDGRPRSLKDMANAMNCSREWIRQQINLSLRKLKYGNNDPITRSIKKELKEI